MRIHNLEELRKIHREIKEKEEKANNAEIQTQEAMVLAAFAQVLELHRIARLEGLLSLEEMVDISDASQRILTSIIELIDAGEIAGRYEYLVPFYQLVSVDTKSLQQKPAQIHQLKKMVEEFEQASGLMKEYIDV